LGSQEPRQGAIASGNLKTAPRGDQRSKGIKQLL
jgi:hypothetical protein